MDRIKQNKSQPIKSRRDTLSRNFSIGLLFACCYGFLINQNARANVYTITTHNKIKPRKHFRRYKSVIENDASSANTCSIYLWLLSIIKPITRLNARRILRFVLKTPDAENTLDA